MTANSDVVSLPTRASEFWAGVKATTPLVIGAIPFGIIFGALAGSSNLSAGGALAMSAFVFAGSAQFIAITLLAKNAAAAVIILTTFVVNLRHALYSTSLAPHVKHLSQRWLLPLAFWLTDETFVIVISHYNTADKSPYKHWYFLGSEVFMYSNWLLCTLIGVLAGQYIKDPTHWGLDFAMVATFIGILVPSMKNRSVRIAVLVAGVISIVTYSMPNKLGLIVSALAGIIVGLAAETFWPETATQPVMERPSEPTHGQTHE